MNTDNLLSTDFFKVMPPEFISSMIVCLTVIIITLVIYFKGKNLDPLKAPKGIVGLAEMAVEYGDNMVKDAMGSYFDGFAKYVLPIALYVFLSFAIGTVGIPNLIVIEGNTSGLGPDNLFSALPSCFSNLAFPLSLGFLTLVMINVVSIRYKKIKWAQQFIAPIPFVGLISFWSPMISLSLRIFGNALAGFILETLLYSLLYSMGNGFGLLLSPLLMPVIHAYFDLFSGVIQTLVFTMISMLDIAQEGPDDGEQVQVAKKVTLKANA